MSDAVLGAVLVGGASRRMGTDKATLLLDGTPMAHRVERALFDGGAGTVVEVGTPDGVPDRWPGEGPLGGIATAVCWGAATEGIEIVVIAACDQPGLTGDVIARLTAALLPAPADVIAAACTGPDGRRQPFPAAWRVSVADALAGLVDAGSRRADAAFTVGPVVDVPAGAEVLADLDAPEDVARWTDEQRSGLGEPPGNRP